MNFVSQRTALLVSAKTSINFIQIPLRSLFLLILLFAFAGCALMDAQEEPSDSVCENHPQPELCEDVAASRFSVFEGQNLAAQWQSDGFLISFDKSEFAKLRLPNCNPKEGREDFDGCRLALPSDRWLDFEKANYHPSSKYKDRLRKTLKTQRKNLFVSRIQSSQVGFTFRATEDACTLGVAPELASPNTLQSCSLNALDAFENAVANQLKREPYSHVILYATGWNNSPTDSVQHYSRAIRSLRSEAKSASKRFEPLFIGVTWPSYWRVPIVSYQNKANDADELGHLWLNYLLNQTLPRAIERGSAKSNPTRLIAIGHSFGARAMATAAVSKNYVKWPDQWQENALDTLILLQPAFSGSRMYSDPKKAHLGHFNFYHGLANRGTSVVTTSSDGDIAVRFAIHSDDFKGHLGSGATWDSICDRPAKPGLVTHGDVEHWRNRFFCADEKQSDFMERIYDTMARDGKLTLLKMSSSIPEHSRVTGQALAKVLVRLITE